MHKTAETGSPNSKVSEILILLKSSVCQIYLKLQRLIAQSISNSDTFQIPYMWNILNSERLIVQSIRNSDTFQIPYM